jgi:hypothetical protein
MSTNTGFAPVIAAALAVAAKVKVGTITSSPGPIPKANRPKCRADVPELRATQALPDTNFEKEFSNSATVLP